MKRGLAIVAIVLVAIAAVAFVALALQARPYERSLQRDLVRVGDDRLAALVLVERTRPFSNRRGYATVSRNTHGLDLVLFDAKTAQPIETIAVVARGDETTLRNEGRLLGYDGRQLWLLGGSLRYLHDDDLGDASTLLGDAMPSESKYFAFEDGRLQIKAADGVTYRVDPGTRNPVEHVEAPSRPAKNQAEYRVGKRRYDHAMAMFGVGPEKYLRRGRAVAPDRYLGLFDADDIDWAERRVGEWFSEDLSATYGDDERRRLVEIKLVDAGRDDGDPNIESVRVVGDGAWIKAGFLREADTPFPIRLSNPDGFLLIHRARIDRLGTMLVSRLTDEGQTLWTVDTQRARLAQVLPHPDFPAFVGAPVEPEGRQMAPLELTVVDVGRGALATSTIE